MISEADIRFPEIPFKKTAALIGIGLAIYLAYIYLTGIDSLKQVVLGADFRYVGIAVILSLVGNLFHTAGWWVLLKKGMGYRISIFNTYVIYLSSTFFATIIPSAAVSGEVAKIYFIQRGTPDTLFDRTLAAGLVSRILEILPTSLGVLIGVLYLALFYRVPGWVLGFCIVIAGAFLLIGAGIFIVALNNALLRRLTASCCGCLGKIFKKRDFTRTSENLDCVLRQFDGSLRSLTRKPLLVATALALIFIAWGFDVAVAYCSFLALGYQVDMGLVITIFSVVAVLQLLPTFLPGGLGFIDVVMTVMYGALGIPLGIAKGATFIIRLITLWFLASLGGAVTIYLLRKHGKSGMPLPATGPEVP